MLQDYHVHALAHGEFSYTYDWLKAFVIKAQEQGIRELGFSEHDEYLNQIDYDIFRKLKDKFPDMNIKLGLEVDYIPGREDYIREISSKYDFDYLIGSVHYINGWGFDHPDFRYLFNEKDIDEVYHSYFNLVNGAIESGLFDLVGHLDLIKIWGHRPLRYNLLYYLEPLFINIKKQNMAVEINSAGLRKPVKEIYPAPKIVDLIISQGIPVTLGSDAHHPSQLGEGLHLVRNILKRAGCTCLATFAKRQLDFLPL